MQRVTVKRFHDFGDRFSKALAREDHETAVRLGLNRRDVIVIPRDGVA